MIGLLNSAVTIVPICIHQIRKAMIQPVDGVNVQKEHIMDKTKWIWCLLCIISVGMSFCPLGNADYNERIKKSAPTSGNWGPKLLQDIPLRWKPTEVLSTYEAVDSTIYNKVQFEVRLFTDIRPRPSEIGENIEKKPSGEGLLVTTRDNVAEWLTETFAKVLSGFNVNVVKSNPTFLLEADIIKFFVTEQSVYHGEVALKIRLKAPNGDNLWEGLISGKASNFGKSYKAENYYEVLSNALINNVYSLLKNETFVKAVERGRQ